MIYVVSSVAFVLGSLALAGIWINYRNKHRRK